MQPIPVPTIAPQQWVTLDTLQQWLATVPLRDPVPTEALLEQLLGFVQRGHGTPVGITTHGATFPGPESTPDRVPENTGQPTDHVELPTGAKRSNIYPPGHVFPARYDLLFRNASALRRLAETWGEGEAAYGPDNWTNGFPESVLMSHALEHLRLFSAGDQADDHLSHAVWNLMALMWVQDNKPELCDLTKLKQAT